MDGEFTGKTKTHAKWPGASRTFAGQQSAPSATPVDFKRRLRVEVPDILKKTGNIYNRWDWHPRQEPDSKRTQASSTIR